MFAPAEAPDSKTVIRVTSVYCSQIAATTSSPIGPAPIIAMDNGISLRTDLKITFFIVFARGPKKTYHMAYILQKYVWCV